MTTAGYQPFPAADLPLPLADFSSKVQTNTATTTFASGRPRRRRLGVGKYRAAKLTWSLSPEEYDLFMAWWEHALQLGTAPFSITMATGEREGEHLCLFVSDPEETLQGYFWRVSMDTVIYSRPELDELALLERLEPGASDLILTIPDVMSDYYTRSWQ